MAAQSSLTYHPSALLPHAKCDAFQTAACMSGLNRQCIFVFWKFCELDFSTAGLYKTRVISHAEAGSKEQGGLICHYCFVGKSDHSVSFDAQDHLLCKLFSLENS